MLSKEIINFMKENIVVKNTKDWQLSANCFLYGINCNVPKYKISYVDDKGDVHYGYNVGEASDSCKVVSSKEELRLSFLNDCEALGIEAKAVAEDYELTDENEWLVAIYYTKPFLYEKTELSDFHFIKKNFSEDTWTHKLREETVRTTDKTGFLITSPTNFVWYEMDDDNHCIDYEYVDTYCLRKKDLTVFG